MNVKPHRKGMETMAENSKASLYKKLLAVQKAASVGKNRYNDYSDYYYRTLGDLFAAIKPTLMEQNAVIYIEDEIVLIGTDTICDKNGNVTRTGEKAYVKATVHFIDCETGEEVTTSAYARECRHNNMSDDQSSGSASSYARKYAINAMFLFDEGADADSQNNQNRNSAPKNNQGQGKKGNNIAWGGKNNGNGKKTAAEIPPIPDDVPLPEPPPQYASNRQPTNVSGNNQYAQRKSWGNRTAKSTPSEYEDDMPPLPDPPPQCRRNRTA